MSKQIFIVKPDTLSSTDKAKLSKNGIIVIEHVSPEDVRIIRELDEINGNDLLMSAMAAIVTNFPQAEFTRNLSKRLLNRERNE